jgi:hypothetical protein
MGLDLVMRLIAGKRKSISDECWRLGNYRRQHTHMPN